jgi:deferrochelatase/peroxidase EfeB
LSELQEEDEDEDRSEAATQREFNKRKKKGIDDEANKTAMASAAAVSNEKIESVKTAFTKQLEAMQTMINQ